MNWLLVAVHVGQEAKAAANLQGQGFEIYFPQIEKRVSHARKVHMVRRPLFPGYIFLNHTNAEKISLRPVRSTVGVKDFVRFGMMPAHVPTKIISDIIAREVNGVIPAAPLSQVIPVGTSVRVVMGALKDMVATVLGYDAQERVMLLLDFLSRQIKAEVPFDALERY